MTNWFHNPHIPHYDYIEMVDEDEQLGNIFTFVRNEKQESISSIDYLDGID